jgi:hypothetical protein
VIEVRDHMFSKKILNRKIFRFFGLHLSAETRPLVYPGIPVYTYNLFSKYCAICFCINKQANEGYSAHKQKLKKGSPEQA